MPRAPRPWACGARLLPQVERWGRAAPDHCAFPPEALVLPSVAAASLPWCAGTRWRTAASSSPASRAGTTPRRPGSRLVSPAQAAASGPAPAQTSRRRHAVPWVPVVEAAAASSPSGARQVSGQTSLQAGSLQPLLGPWGSDGFVCSCRVLGDSLLHVVSGCQTQEAARCLFRLSCDFSGKPDSRAAGIHRRMGVIWGPRPGERQPWRARSG